MSKVTIKNIQDLPCDLYDNENKFVGRITNILQFDDVRVQIGKQKLTGYYIVFLGNKIDIDQNGQLSEYPAKLFDTITNLYFILEEMKYRKVNKNPEHECGAFCDPIDCPNHGRNANE